MSYILSFMNLLVSLLLLGIITYLYKKKFDQRVLQKKNKKKNYILIKTSNEFKIYFESLRNSKIIGVDTEYYSGKKYKGSLCLIQLFIEKFPFALIIDVISLSENSKLIISNLLKEILSNEKIEKVFHACYNDIEWIKEEFGIETYNIFDIQEMHQIATHSNSNLKNLVDLIKIYLNINMSIKEKKKFQTSNWYERPLSEEQLNYAANDSIFLIKLRNKIVEKINDKKKIEETKKKMQINLYNSSKKEKNLNKANKFLIDNMTKINTNYFDYIKQLFSDLMNLTDEYAKENNINNELILCMKIIYKICIKLPKTKEEIMTIISSKYSKEIITIHKTFYEKITDFILSKTQNLKEDNLNVKEISKNNEMLRNFKKEINKKTTLEKFSCKNPIYENCKMLAPDGQQLCFCDNKKMEWYISRNLAKKISENPPIFQLIFEPNAKGCVNEKGENSDFYISSRKNCCVICGKEDNYMRFHIVPFIYRQFFPENLKSHKSHDVALLCFNCHENCCKSYEEKKKNIAEQFKIPLNSLSDDQKLFKNKDEFIKKCKAAYKNWNVIPEKSKDNILEKIYNLFIELKQSKTEDDDIIKVFQKNNYLNTIKSYKDINYEFIEKFKDYKIDEMDNEKRKNVHGKLVVEKVKDIREFIREWRLFFVETFSPKFLPKEWSIDHEMIRTFGEKSNFKNNEDLLKFKTKKDSMDIIK